MQDVTLCYVFCFGSILWICRNMESNTHTHTPPSFAESQNVISAHSLDHEMQIQLFISILSNIKS